jgi:hypothetical protein
MLFSMVMAFDRRSGRGVHIATLFAGGAFVAACVSGQAMDLGDADDGGDGEAAMSGSAGSGTGSGGSSGNAQGGAAGQVGTGGSDSGGAMGSGGTPASGGAFPTGGTVATGGAFPSGGTVATGGTSATGGTTTGGTPATGGTTSGGTSGKGGTSTGGTSTGGTSTGGTGGSVAPPPNINGGQMAWASRYWDCCKPACGWTGNIPNGGPAMQSCNLQNQSLGSDFGARNACEGGGTAFMCWNGAPWSVGGQLSYGFAAASGGNYRCGACYHIQFNGTGHNGTNPGVQAINGKHMIIQIINNGGVAQDQFDLLIPGGGVGALNACDDQWAGANLGAQYGGFRATCGTDTNCVRQMCQSAFSNKPELMAGCEWYINWFGAADNPNFVYERIACPSALTQRSGLRDPG